MHPKTSAIILPLTLAIFLSGCNVVLPQTQENPANDVANTSALPEGFTTYKDTKSNFQISYPDTIFKKSTYSCTIPVNNEKSVTDSSAVSLEHSFPFVWQDGKGDTRQKIADMAVRLCVVGGDYRELADYYGGSTDVTINGRAAQKVEMGVEGTGADYYYFSLSNTTTLVVGYYYVTPFADKKLSEEKEYIPVQKQKELFQQILGTLEFE